MAPFIRILLRYLAGYLIAQGFLTRPDAEGIIGDPEVIVALETVLGFAIAGVNEIWYWLARKFGWAK